MIKSGAIGKYRFSPLSLLWEEVLHNSTDRSCDRDCGTGYLCYHRQGDKWGDNSVRNRQKVLSAIQQNPHIKRQELISSLEIGKGTLDRSLKKLKGKGILRRIGSNKTGYWKCVL